MSVREPQATFVVTGNDGAVVVDVAGELDLAVIEQLRASLSKAASLSPHLPIVVDLAGATFVDSMSIGTIVKAFHDAQAQGRPLRLANPSPIASRVLQIMGVYEALTGTPVTSVPEA